MAGDRVYPIGVVAEITGLHEQTIRRYERQGLVKPRRSPGGTRYYGDADLRRLLAIRELVDLLGVNLAGVEVILHMRERENDLLGLAREMFRWLDADAREFFKQVIGPDEPGLVRTQPGEIARKEKG